MTEENQVLVLAPDETDIGKRLDAYLAEKIAEKVGGWSRSRLQRLIEDGDVLVNQKPVKSSYKINISDEIEVELTAAVAASNLFAPEDIPLDIVYEDQDIAVINKSAGMVVHPGAGVSTGTLANALAFHFAGLSKADEVRPGIVHRLDKDTSGLIVVAKNEAAHENLGEQFSSRKVFKSYLALVHGQMEASKGKIEEPIARDRSNRLRMAVIRSGRGAVSLWRVRQSFEKFTLLGVEIKTGRTHQIRVHLAHIRHPVVGDETYNGGRDNTIADPQIRKAVAGLSRFFLHAERLEFEHPATGELVKFYSALPPELEGFLQFLL
ncbi:MAG TPA: RluA family pseudouridine synthase [Pyrinomonadaceae bacterium]|nr:RluA family pseudouridine synthase [Pyrinomonadaceae bacterium]